MKRDLEGAFEVIVTCDCFDFLMCHNYPRSLLDAYCRVPAALAAFSVQHKAQTLIFKLGRAMQVWFSLQLIVLLLGFQRISRCIASVLLAA